MRFNRNSLLFALAVFVALLVAQRVRQSMQVDPPQIRAALPTPGVPRTVPVCALTTPGSAWTKHLIHNGIRGSDGVRLADFDSDGDQDVVSPWEQSGFTTLSLNPGSSAVRAAASWSTAQIISMPANEGACIADWDQDGRLDIASMSQGGGSPIVAFGPASNTDLLDPSDWTMMTLTGLNASGVGYMTCRGADITGDGHLELIIGGDTGGAAGEFFYLVGPSAAKRTAASWPNFAARTTVEASSRVMSIWVLDLDGDTDLDMLWSNRGGGNNGLRRGFNNGSGTFTIGSITTAAFMLFRPFDIDDDGDLDTCSVTDSAVTPTMTCSTNIGGTFTKWVQTSPNWPTSFGSGTGAAVEDLNLDGYPDIILASYDAAAGSESGLAWLKGPSWTRGEIEGTAHTVISKWDEVEFVDLDDDGDLDIIAGNSGNEDGSVDADEGLYWFENPCLD